ENGSVASIANFPANSDQTSGYVMRKNRNSREFVSRKPIQPRRSGARRLLGLGQFGRRRGGIALALGSQYERSSLSKGPPMRLSDSQVLHRSLRGALPIAVRGSGVHLVDADGRDYIDACGGAAVSCL